MDMWRVRRHKSLMPAGFGAGQGRGRLLSKLVTWGRLLSRPATRPRVPRQLLSGSATHRQLLSGSATQRQLLSRYAAKPLFSGTWRKDCLATPPYRLACLATAPWWHVCLATASRRFAGPTAPTASGGSEGHRASRIRPRGVFSCPHRRSFGPPWHPRPPRAAG